MSTQESESIGPCLVLLTGSTALAGYQWALSQGAMILGRSPECGIQVSEPGVSKAHAKFTLVSEEASVTDLGATNATFVNGNPLTPNVPYPLKNNDQVIIAGVVLKFLQRGHLAQTGTTGSHAVYEAARSEHYESLSICGRTRPAGENEGDWWWHWSSGAKAFVIMGEVSGKGSGAGTITSAARLAVMTLETDPLCTIEKVYSTVSEVIRQVSQNAMKMAALIVEYDLRDRTLLYINASHVPPLLLPATGVEGQPQVVSGSRAASLGAAEAQAGPLEVGRLEVGRGARLVLLTDGLSERKNPQGMVLTEKAFNKIIMEAHVAHPSDQEEFLETIFKKSDAVTMSKVEDDITVVALDFT